MIYIYLFTMYKNRIMIFFYTCLPTYMFTENCWHVWRTILHLSNMYLYSVEFGMTLNAHTYVHTYIYYIHTGTFLWCIQRFFTHTCILSVILNWTYKSSARLIAGSLRSVRIYWIKVSFVTDFANANDDLTLA